MYLYRPPSLQSLESLFIHDTQRREREESLHRCAGYMADMLWLLASDKRLKADTIAPYTTQMLRRAEKAQTPQETEDFLQILRKRVKDRKEGGDPA